MCACVCVCIWAYIPIYMYVCMYEVCVDVCMQVFYVPSKHWLCINPRNFTGATKYLFKSAENDHKDLLRHGHVCMYVCMYVYICVYVCVCAEMIEKCVCVIKN